MELEGSINNLNRKLDISSMTKCHNSFELPGYPGIPIRCRKCPGCIDHRRMEWKNRLMLEQFGKNYKPLFITWTFDSQHYLDSPRNVINETQKLYKRLRKKCKLRYFTSVERGKKGRLHAHSIVWSQYLSKMDYYNLCKMLRKKWKNGAVNVRFVHTSGAFAYTTKYLLKETSDFVDLSTGDIKKCRNYTWSNKPRMGYSGIQRWLYLSDLMKGVPANWFNQHMFGKLEKTYIPSSVYIKYLKDNGLIDIPTEDMHSEILSDVDFDSLLLKWREEKEDRIR